MAFTGEQASGRYDMMNGLLRRERAAIKHDADVFEAPRRNRQPDHIYHTSAFSASTVAQFLSLGKATNVAYR